MDKKYIPYLFVLPSTLVLVIFYLFPLISMGALSFTDWNMAGMNFSFVGLKNYETLLADAIFWKVVKNTFYYTFWYVLWVVVLSLPLAIWLNKNTLIHKIAQAALFSPHIVALVSVSLIFMFMMDPDIGMFNQILGVFGIEPVGWLSNGDIAMNSLVLVSVWKSLGYYTLIFLAALQSIPKDIYEAAKMDRANWMRTFTKITIPNIMPTIFFVIIINIINAVQVFETINIMTEGGPANATKTLVYFIYEDGFKFFNVGRASAAGMILFVILVVFTFFYFRVMAKRVQYGK
ncbi:sugar ABC transporter permease [Peptoniphilus sp. KCTC 25270]|uniref:carbohydrate ABC transporter permease n=1 Tax=Peptoniphilus sp. KCTC 25270 TaxID=2897414 RepID=UPI001E5FA65F|nr:sugar ABC transporter permease [Peptoniphilus sp. KCTC 25270]MCD1147881.1 sugar ABC transporter permease [Peptoniphilus sp. KCTC 25270]